MPEALALSAHTGYIEDNAVINRLITTAQHVPTTQVTDEDGEERTVYGTTPEADDALAQLTTAFLPLLHKVARTSKVLDEDDALAVCLEEFISCIRRYEVGSALQFKQALRTILLRKIGDVGRTSGLIVVKENVAARYRQLMDRHDWDLEAAYQECKTSNNGFDPDTFLKVHNSIGVDSLDASQGGTRFTGSEDSSRSTSKHEEYLADPEPNPEDITVQTETVRWLFTLVDDEAEKILRLAYGFDDLATENSRLAKGYRADGSPMSDREVAHVLGKSTPTVNRRRNAALGVMREALLEDEEDVTAA